MSFDIESLKPLIVDIVVVAFMLLVSFGKAKKGLYKSLAPFVVTVLAIVIGIFAARILLPIVKPYVIDFVNNKVAEYYDFSKLHLPDALEKTLFGNKLNELSEKIIQVALCIVCTIIALLILNILKSIFAPLANWSAIGLVNHGLGFIFGLCEAFLIVLITIKIGAWANSSFVSSLPEDTVILKWMCGVDIKTVLDEIKELVKGIG